MESNLYPNCKFWNNAKNVIGFKFGSFFYLNLLLNKVKQKENEAALLNLSQRLETLDKLPWHKRQIEIIEGILAGNVFDWGANEIVK